MWKQDAAYHRDKLMMMHVSERDVLRFLATIRDRDERIQGLATALRDLHDIQNGPPLIKCTNEWNEIIARAIKLLKEVERE